MRFGQILADFNLSSPQQASAMIEAAWQESEGGESCDGEEVVLEMRQQLIKKIQSRQVTNRTDIAGSNTSANRNENE